ncbi:helix-turn-helix domain-containing protein [Microlunatus sp. Y2014]|uniref:helix-turn-helix domain-containing protein n=1 Tax=Microlunatus sp. Y2014 TaxID=3418488 RepID=UPI003DA79C19
MIPAELQGRLTVTVPVAGQMLGIGRDAAYAAAERGELPSLRIGRRIVVPVPKLLDLLGLAQHSETAEPEGPAAA